jgi:hypothetical protein
MNTADYASGIRGFRLLQEAGLRYEYQTTTACSLESAVKLVTDLPANCEICFFDPEEKREEAYVFVRRAGADYMVMRARHGVFSDWEKESVERIVTLFQESPLVKKPSDSFESFRVSLIPDHQRRWHIDGRLPTDRPWWKFWS